MSAVTAPCRMVAEAVQDLAAQEALRLFGEDGMGASVAEHPNRRGGRRAQPQAKLPLSRYGGVCGRSDPLVWLRASHSRLVITRALRSDVEQRSM